MRGRGRGRGRGTGAVYTPEQAAAILGKVDAKKLRSSMTLFAAVPDAPDAFKQVIDTFYGGSPCPLTIEALADA